jgi:hypothetical protein
MAAELNHIIVRATDVRFVVYKRGEFAHEYEAT